MIRILSSFKLNDSELLKLNEEKFQEIDQSAKEETKVPYKKQVEKSLEKRGCNQIKDNMPPLIKKEEFISYEQWLKIGFNGSNLDSSDFQSTDMTLAGSWVLVGDSINDEERQQIDRYISTLILEQPVQHSGLQDSIMAQQDSMRQVQNLISLKQVLQKQMARSYLTDNLYAALSKYKSYYIVLSDDQFSELVSIVRHWINYIDVNDVFDCEEIYKLLILSQRIVVNRKGSLGMRQTLVSMMSDLELWTKQNKWSQLYFYICTKKIEDKKKKALMLLKQSQSTGIIKKGFGMLGKGFSLIKNLGQERQQQLEVDENQVAYFMLEEINSFVIALQLKPQVSADIVLYIAMQINVLDKDQILKLLEKQENRNNSHLRKQLNNGKTKLQQMINKHETDKLYDYPSKVAYSFQLCLSYLALEDKPQKLLLINKTFHQKLQHKINKFYLCNIELLYSIPNEKYRVRFLKTFLQIDKSQVNYIDMKIRVGIDMNIQHTNIEEIISLDVQRSLHIHSSRISSSILQSLLRTYAFFNEEVGYCQGMNYIAGYLFLTFNDEEVTFKAFDKIMNTYFATLFIKDFEKLKLRFYQFDRLFSVFLPELSDHFKQEKIDPSYYAASWFITIFSNVFQYQIRSALLNNVWDVFLVEEWKGFFKLSFYILYLLQSKLLKLEFDEILQTLSDIIRSDLFKLEDEVELIKYVNTILGNEGKLALNKSIKTEILNKFRITNKLLQQLESEYSFFQLNFNAKYKEYQNDKAQKQ